jgi:hypothetical protein
MAQALSTRVLALVDHFVSCSVPERTTIPYATTTMPSTTTPEIMTLEELTASRQHLDLNHGVRHARQGHKQLRSVDRL